MENIENIVDEEEMECFFNICYHEDLSKSDAVIVNNTRTLYLSFHLWRLFIASNQYEREKLFKKINIKRISSYIFFPSIYLDCPSVSRFLV